MCLSFVSLTLNNLNLSQASISLSKLSIKTKDPKTEETYQFDPVCHIIYLYILQHYVTVSHESDKTI